MNIKSEFEKKSFPYDDVLKARGYKFITGKEDLIKLSDAITIVESREKEIETISDFANKIAKAMKEISSSHVYFIIQQAFGEIDWGEAEKILENVIVLTELKSLMKGETK